MATFTIDPTQPPNSENPQNGATRIRNVAGWILNMFGYNPALATTFTVPPSPNIDGNTGFLFSKALPGAIQLTGSNAGTTQFSISAGLVYMFNPNQNYNLVQSAPGTVTCTIVGGQSGAVLNARDQTAAFGANTFYHLYLIGGGGQTPGTIASLTAPFSGGPTLPASYTSYGYLATLLTDASGNVMQQYLRGNTVFYATAQNVLTNGTSTAGANVSTSAFVPSLASIVQLYYHATTSSFNSTFPAIEIGYDTSHLTPTTSAFELKPAYSSQGTSGWVQIANAAQNVAYKWILNGATNQALDLEILGYQVPNGSS